MTRTAGDPSQRKILWIHRGALLRDDKTLRDYPTVKQDDIVHVHIIRTGVVPRLGCTRECTHTTGGYPE